MPSISFRLASTMPWKLWIRAGELVVTAILALALFTAWQADRKDRSQLAAELAAAKEALSQADTRQHDRDSQLLQTLATLAIDKRSVTTPAQIIQALPQQLSLPTPVTLQPLPVTQPAPKSAAKGDRDTRAASASPSRGNQPKDNQQNQQQAIIPTEDLQPLYDFALDCKACQAKLAAAQGDLTDEKSKTTTLTKERDEAVRIAKGGSILRRIARAAKWLAIGAAAGAIAARAAH